MDPPIAATPIPSPPATLLEVVGCGGLEVGEAHVDQLRQLAELRPHDAVLDVGCGIGRTAIPLTSFLSGGTYAGFDIWPEAVEWCSEEITSRFPNFRFTLVDLFNAAYNPAGRGSPSSFRFPYADDEFDVAFLYSVFTHMLAKDFERYLSELARVLKKGGRMVASFFLLNSDSLQKLASAADATTPEGNPVARFLLERDFGTYRAGYDVPEWLVAYEESFVRDAFREAGFELQEPIRYGTWVEWACGKAPSLTQDTTLVNRQ